MNLRAPLRTLLFICAAAACSEDSLLPAGNLVLHIDTDAPLPPRPGGSAKVPPLFERMRIEVLDGDGREACDGCSRDFDVDEGMFQAGVSMTIQSQRSASLRARVRLFRSASIANQNVSPWSTIDTWVELPAIPSEGSRHLSIFLPTDHAGVPIGSNERPAFASEGPPPPSRVGTWGSASRVPCVGEPRAKEVCVPGGAFWMGAPSPIPLQGDLSTGERLVVLSPFFLLDHEVTVAEFRSVPGLAPPLPWTGKYGVNLRSECRYTSAPGPHEDIPVNCLAWSRARAYCLAVGSDLPSEAQFEYVASGTRSTPFPWGNEDPQCADVVWGRGAGAPTGTSDTCKSLAKKDSPGSVGGPLPVPTDTTSVTSSRRAFVLESGAVIWDLAGNVSEFSVDDYSHNDAPCWSKADSNLFFDPVCTSARDVGETGPYSVRGGNWAVTASSLRASVRMNATQQDASGRIGFRCARPASP